MYARDIVHILVQGTVWIKIPESKWNLSTKIV